MRKAHSEAGQVDVSDMWPAVELTPTGVSQKLSLKWAQDKIVELKTCNVRFIRAMDTAGVDPARLAEDFARSFEFFGTADGYLTVALQTLRSGGCTPRQLPSLFSAISQLVDSLGEARRQMLEMMPDHLRRQVVESEPDVYAGPEDVEEEMIEIGRVKVEKRRVAGARR
ncbi:MAG: hypothetical protein JW952_06480 [Candidatus Eisenbacteria bacterium]|nr:hypothetical protein [Candidatus Eisenbacteria bacterium]